jgi:hypothetical protein
VKPRTIEGVRAILAAAIRAAGVVLLLVLLIQAFRIGQAYYAHSRQYGGFSPFSDGSATSLGVFESLWIATIKQIMSPAMVLVLLCYITLIAFPQTLARWLLPMPDPARCPRCRYTIGRGAAECSECGLPLDEANPKPPRPKPNNGAP